MTDAPRLPRRLPRGFRFVGWAVLAVALGVAATGGLDRLSADAVVYLRLGGHWAAGEFRQAVSPYWGPLFAWAAAPLLAIGVEPVLAGRIVLALSALLFVYAVGRLLRATRVRRRSRVLALCVAGLFAVARAGESITPDLLLTAFLSLACVAFLRGDGRWGGIWVGLAALTKPVGLPIGALAGVGLIVLRRLVDGAPWRRPLTGAALAGALVVVPWAATLVTLHGWEAPSRSARVNHALVGPDPSAPEHPGAEGFRPPPAGAKSVWTNPTGRGYGYWSPLESWGAFGHQLEVTRHSLRSTTNYLLDLDLFALGPLAVLAAFFFHRPWRRNLRAHRWRWMGVPFLASIVVYLPVYSSSIRYFYPAYAFFLPAVFGLAAWLGAGPGRANRRRRRLFAWVVFVSLAGPAGTSAWEAVAHAVPDPAVAEARAAAARLREAGIRGPVAADARDRLYLSFFLDAPWHGWRATGVAPDDFRESGAELIAVGRGSPLAALLARDARFEDLDPRLRAPAELGVRLFRVRPRGYDSRAG